MRMVNEFGMLFDYAMFWGPRDCKIARMVTPCHWADVYVRSLMEGEPICCTCHEYVNPNDMIYHRIPKAELDGRNEYNYPGVPATKPWPEED